jgi:AAA family ATP:ADP antiporter
MTLANASERLGLRNGELRATAAASGLFFLVLCSYYILRPIRDELSTRNPSQLQWLFTGTFLATLLTVPLFGGIVSHFSRRKVLPITIVFFASHLLVFYFLFERGQISGWVAYAFFIWLSVYNLLVVSAMWSLFNDIFRSEQAKRLYGFVAAGGSMGAIVGPLLTASAVKIVGAVNLMLLSGVLLAGSIPLVFYLFRWSSTHNPGPAREENIGGSIWSGVRLTLSSSYLLKISLLLVALTFLATALYFQQASVLRSEVSTPEGRTQVLAAIDLAVNILALLVEFTAVGPLLVRFGPGPVLAGLLVLNAAGFVALGMSPVLLTLALFQVFRRTTDYALVRPVREVFFTVVSREEKYKAKNFVDVVVFRGGDAVSGWAISGLQAIGVASPQIALLCAPIAIGAALLSRSLGNDESRKHAVQPATLEVK